MTRRPAGVILSAVILGLAALFLVLLAAVTTLSIAFMHHPPSANAAIALSTPPPPAFFTVIALMATLFYLALAVWAIATLVGLLRMKPWSRISIMIIGGGLAAIGLFSALISFAMPTLMATAPMPANADPAMLHAVFAGMAIVCLLIAALGIAWLVYFALRSTREAFRPIPLLPPDPNAPIPLPHAHTLSFYEAQPMTSAPPPISAEPQNFYTEGGKPVPQPIPVRKRPVSITILAVLFFLTATCSIPSLFLGFPLLLCGILLSGWPAHIAVFSLILWTGLTGGGLLGLKKPAWIAAMAYCIFGLINGVLMALPSGRLRMSQYMQDLQSRTSMGMPQPSFDIWNGPLFNLIVVPGMIFGAAIVIFAMVLLWRARWAFEPDALTPPTEPTL
jgi:hypothetical protein